MMEHKVTYENIEIPAELSGVIDKNIEKAHRARKLLILKPLTLVAACVLVFILTVNTIPAFATLIDKVPILSNIVDFVKFDKGLKTAAEKGYVQQINKSVEDQGIKFTIKEIIFDKKRLLVFYRIDSELNIDNINLENMKLLDSSGTPIKCFLDMNIDNKKAFMSTKFREDVLDISMPDVENFPESIRFNLESFNAIREKEEKETAIKGNWNIDVKLNSTMLNIEPRVLKYDKTAQIGEMKFNLKNINVFPCSVRIDVEMDETNPYKFCGFINPRLVDKKGNEYVIRVSAIKSDEMRVMHFESNYFIDSEDLKLEFDGIYYMPKEPQIIKFDLRNNKIINDPGYDLEFMYARNDFMTEAKAGAKSVYVIGFKINDKEINENMRLPGTLWAGLEFGKMYDDKGMVYQSGGSGMNGPGLRSSEAIERFIYINDFSPIPDVLNVEVISTNKGILEKLSLKLK